MEHRYKNRVRQVSKRIMHRMHATGRLTEQVVWQWTGKQNARTEMQQAGVMVNSQALIPLVRYNSRFNIIPMPMHIFIQLIRRLCFTFRPAFLASYYSDLFIYLQYIIPMDYILTTQFYLEKGIRIRYSSNYHPHGNGLAESINKNLSFFHV